ncbi:hypothetical protein [Halorientalis salina]|nr:hypothetical protein [Halorientalis salina]
MTGDDPQAFDDEQEARTETLLDGDAEGESGELEVPPAVYQG